MPPSSVPPDDQRHPLLHDPTPDPHHAATPHLPSVTSHPVASATLHHRRRAARRFPAGVPRAVAVLLPLALLVTLLRFLGPAAPHEGPQQLLRDSDDDGDGDDPVPRAIRGHDKDCADEDFKKRTLRLVAEVPMAAFFGDRSKKYSISDITGPPPSPPSSSFSSSQSSSGPGQPPPRALLAVHDEEYALVHITPAQTGRSLAACAAGLPVAACNATRLPWPPAARLSGEESSFEFIAYNASSRTYLVGSETVDTPERGHHAHASRVYDVALVEPPAPAPGAAGAHQRQQREAPALSVMSHCDTEYSFPHRNKGIEGAVVATVGGRSLLLALCEGNRCDGGKDGRDPGHGRILVLERNIRPADGRCEFRTRSIAKLPAKLDFQDYSAMALWGDDTIAIVSQENAAMFVGKLRIDHDTDEVSIGADEDDDDDGVIFDFPRNDQCEIKYCNIEGVFFLDRYMVATVSDTMKKKGKQHFRCREKDESFQIFQIPR